MLATKNTARKRRGGKLLRLAATGLLVTLTACSPPGPKALLDGERLYRSGAYSEALDRFLVASELLPANAHAWNYLGLAYHALNKAPEARQAYGQAITRDRNLAIARFNLGCLLLETGDYPSAVNELTTFTVLQPQSEPGFVKLAEAQLKNHAIDQAEVSLRKALQLNPRNPESLSNLGWVLVQKRRVRDAYNQFLAAIQADPKYAPALVNLAVVSQQMNNRPLAIKAYRDYLQTKVEPHMPGADLVKAWIAQLEFEMQPPKPAPMPTVVPPAPASGVNSRLPLTSASNRVVIAASPAPTVPSTAPVSTVAKAPAPTNQPVASAVRPASTAVIPAPAPAKPAATNPPALAAKPPSVNPTAAPSLAQRAPAPLPPEVKPEAKPLAVESPKPTSEPKPTLVTNDPKPAVPAPASVETPKSVASAPDASIAKPAKVVESPAPPPSNSKPVAVVSPAQETVVRPAEVAIAPPPPRSAPAVTNVVANAAAADGKPAEKGGFWQRMNPGKWFGTTEKPAEKKPTPLVGTAPSGVARSSAPAVAAAPSIAPAKASERAGVSLPEVAVKVEPKGPRYVSRLNGRPRAGDREKAGQELAAGMQAYGKARLPEALEAYKRAAAADPSFYDAQYHLGVASMESGDVNSALGAYEAAVTLDPEAIPSRYNFALALRKAGLPIDAAEQARALLKHNPSEVRAHLLLANLASFELGPSPQAREHYLKVLELDPRHPQAAVIRSWLATHP